MAIPSATFDRLDSYAAAQSDVDRVPWFLYAVLFASTSVTSGCSHVFSPDTFFIGDAGPYRVRVSLRLPGVIPGRAQVAVR
jgi:hypothetical protein